MRDRARVAVGACGRIRSGWSGKDDVCFGNALAELRVANRTGTIVVALARATLLGRGIARWGWVGTLSGIYASNACLIRRAVRRHTGAVGIRRARRRRWRHLALVLDTSKAHGARALGVVRADRVAVVRIGAADPRGGAGTRAQQQRTRRQDNASHDAMVRERARSGQAGLHGGPIVRSSRSLLRNSPVADREPVRAVVW
jgi:hypothetical protein